MNVDTWKSLIVSVKQFFRIEELITPSRFKARGEEAWKDFNPEALIMLVKIRLLWGKPLIINNWHKNGLLKNCGLRDEFSIGAQFSGHKLGFCFDLHSDDDIALYTMLVANWDKLYITEIEDKVITITEKGSWVHVSCRPTGQRQLVILR